MTLSSTSTSITLGQSFTLKGGAYPNPGKELIRVQKLNTATDTFETFASPTLSANGYYSVTVKPTASGYQQFRVYKGGSKGHDAGFSAIVGVDVEVNPFRVTLSSNKRPVSDTSGINAGETLTLKGGVYPNPGARVVRIQDFDFDARAYVTVASVTTSTNGFYSYSFKPAAGQHFYRVYKGASDYHDAGASSYEGEAVYVVPNVS